MDGKHENYYRTGIFPTELQIVDVRDELRGSGKARRSYRPPHKVSDCKAIVLHQATVTRGPASTEARARDKPSIWFAEPGEKGGA